MSPPALILRMALFLLLMVYSTDASLELMSAKQDVEVGHEFLLFCKSREDGDITWLKDGEPIEDEEKVTRLDEKSSKLEIKKATFQDAGSYSCECDCESKTLYSATMQIHIHEFPLFSETTLNHEFEEGMEGMMPCSASGKPAVDIVWFKDKQTFPSDEGSRVHQLPNNTLFIKKVTREDAGMYVCQAQIRGRPIYNNSSVSVVVNFAPIVQLKEKEKRVMAGSDTNISIPCLVEGRPTPKITWDTPSLTDPSRLQYNSDGSILIIRSVSTADNGMYVCTATNKIDKSNATLMLHVFEAPEVFVSAEKLSISMGKRVSVSCKVSGHPQPELHWINKHSGQKLDSTSGRVHVVEGVLVIEEVMPSDGGLYSCMAFSTFANASRDVAIKTNPGMPNYLTVLGGLASVLFSLKTLPVSGGTPITSFVLQWRQQPTEEWKEITVPVSESLVIPSLSPFTSYQVHLAARNAIGVGVFSKIETVRTLGKREPSSPILQLSKMKVERNNFSVPLQKSNDGETPLQYYKIRYRQDREQAEWNEIQLPPDADSISLQELSFESSYQLQVTAVNANGSSSSAAFNFTVGPQPASSLTKGSVVGIVIFIFLVVFLAVDITCCYRNHCGVLMSIAVKLFGHKVPGLKMLENGEGTTNGEMKQKGVSIPRGSMQLTGIQTMEGGQLTDVTSDKASLTKHEKTEPGENLHKATA